MPTCDPVRSDPVLLFGPSRPACECAVVSGRRVLLVEVLWLIDDGRGTRVYCCNDEMARRVTTRVQVLEPNAIIGIGINPCARIYMSALLHCTCAYADMPVGRLPSRRPIERLPSRRSEGCPPDVGSPPDGALRVQKSTCRIIQLHQHPTHAHEFMVTTTHALKFTFTTTHAHKTRTVPVAHKHRFV